MKSRINPVEAATTEVTDGASNRPPQFYLSVKVTTSAWPAREVR